TVWAGLARMDRPAIRSYRLRGDRCGVRRAECHVALPFPGYLYDPKGPVAQDNTSKLAIRKMAVCDQICGVAPCASYLLAAGPGAWNGRNRCLRRMHEHCILLQSNYPGALQYSATASFPRLGRRGG